MTISLPARQRTVPLLFAEFATTTRRSLTVDWRSETTDSVASVCPPSVSRNRSTGALPTSPTGSATCGTSPSLTCASGLFRFAK